MALEKSFEKFGTTFSSAYHRISNLNYSCYDRKEIVYSEQAIDENGEPVPSTQSEQWVVERLVNFTVSVYVDGDARDAHSEPVYSRSYSFVPDWSSSDNILSQSYSHLKTLEEYSEAVDA